MKLWDKDFKIVTQLDLAGATTGYKGWLIIIHGSVSYENQWGI